MNSMNAMLATLRPVIDEATSAFDDYDYTRALERTEPFFWSFCDDYLELVKARAYSGDPSAIASLRLALATLLRLFAPFLPFVTEEVWSWWQEGSVHRAPWPSSSDLPAGTDGTTLEIAALVLGEVRKEKTGAKKSLRADVALAIVTGTPEQLAAIEAARSDILEAGRIAELRTGAGEELAVDVTLAD